MSTRICALFFVLSTLFNSVECRAIGIRLPDTDFPEETPAQKFARSDANHDEVLTFDEFLHTELAYERIKKDEFDYYDTNKDGVISIEEYEGHLTVQKERSDELRAEYFGKIYETFDEDFDMKMNEKEVRKMLAERFLLKPRANFAKIFSSFDVNKDGGLEIEEFIKFDEEMPFEELDPLERIDEQPAAILENERLPKTKKPKDDSRF
uniref:EF-hand domain-containing protein n=1 Tax=Ascaris lumbricoides TaxID=6252 RepID=A0A0M3HPF8_ASCLU